MRRPGSAPTWLPRRSSSRPRSLLLATLSGGPAHGYALSAELRRRSDGELVIVEGSLYPALHRLEVAGLVASSNEITDGRRRRQYELTADGKAALREEKRQWELFKACVDTILGVGE